VDRLSSLERAVVNAGSTLSAGSFGAALRERDPGLRFGPKSGPSQLAMFELNAGPPVFRTLIVLDAADRTRRDLKLSPEDREYVRWVGYVQVALRTIADRFWGVIRPDIRLLVYDHDNTQVLHSGPPYVPGLRAKPGASLQTACGRVGIGETELSALAGCWHAAHSSDAYAAARGAATRIQLYDRLRHSLQTGLATLSVQAESAFGAGRTLSDVAKRLNAIADDAYEQSEPEVRVAAEAIRAYHELVQAILWALLGYAEQPPGEDITLTTGLPRMGVKHRWRHLEAQFTATDRDSFPFPKVSAPFRVDGRGLLDGLYICVGFAVHGLGEGGYVDLTGMLLRELERAPL